MKTVLITGAAGFLGSHLCERLLAQGFRVIGMDNFSTGNIDNIELLFKNPHFVFYHHDVTKFVHIPGKLEYILHFASPASPVDYYQLPIQTLKVGSLGAYNLLGLAKEKKSKIVIASTSEVYGDPNIHPQKEDYWGNVNIIGPRGVYDEAKRFQEAITMAYHTYHKINTGIVRIFNTYGPKMRLNDGRALPTFLNQVLNRENVTIFGNGKQTRSFCYVDDLVTGVIKLLLTDESRPMNIGNPDEISILEFAEKIIKLSGYPNQLVFKPLPQDDPKRRCPDISFARERLNWRPVISLEEGLTKTFEYFKLKKAKV